MELMTKFYVVCLGTLAKSKLWLAGSNVKIFVVETFLLFWVDHGVFWYTKLQKRYFGHPPRNRRELRPCGLLRSE